MAVHLPMVDSQPAVDSYLEQQADLRAVQRFARDHGGRKHQPAGSEPVSGVYESLIPLSQPAVGQQYGFQVDLDACTGCKACVVACNKLNGLDRDEAWRMVGLIQGGTLEQPIQQTITTACHHCLDPACANGCPVGAYVKDEVTGIVKHLDDQCIGCQYCTLTCPYEVPRYNERLGIVRKCDMCSGRLAEGEAPACVQACPNGAISIKVVDRQAVLDDAQGDAFLPGAPSPGITAPTTTFKTRRALPRNVLPADFYSLRPGARHLPLVILLVFTQLSVGTFAVEALWSWNDRSVLGEALGRAQSLVAVALGLLALGASIFHLGRPQYAFRAVLGLRRSWMSREIVAFGLFVKLAMLYAAIQLWPGLLEVTGLESLLGRSAEELQRALSLGVATTGLAGVLCSVMIYRVTQRVWWNGTTTGLKFFGTAALLGVATLLVTTAVTGRALGEAELAAALPWLSGWLVVLSVGKLTYEASIFLHLWDKQQGDLKRTALLLRGELSTMVHWRLSLGVAGGVVVPAILYVARPTQVTSVVLLAAGASFLALVVGELLERITFFAAVSAPRMPGGSGR